MTDPASHTEAISTSPNAARLPDPVVCVSDLLWDEHWSSEQQLSSRLARFGRVLYVERPVSLLSFFTKVSDASVGRQLWRSLTGNVREVAPNLTVLTPLPVLPFRFIRLFNVINEWLRLFSIRRCLKKMGPSHPVLWIYPPDAGRIVGRAGEALSIYYCADDWAAQDQWWNRSEDVRARENELAGKVDLIVGTSTRLVERWGEVHPAVMLITNGADVQSFVRARDPELEVPADLSIIPEPRIGYIGFIDKRFDSALYEIVAKGNPQWSFVMVGPVNDRSIDVSHLLALPNVYFLGGRARAELPAYLKGFSVCTIPYVLNQLSESIFPLKLFEYLAAGRQVVATMLPELKPFGRYLRTADSAEAFETALQAGLTTPRETASLEYLRANSWDSKAEVLWNVIAERLQTSSEAKTEVRRLD